MPAFRSPLERAPDQIRPGRQAGAELFGIGIETVCKEQGGLLGFAFQQVGQLLGDFPAALGIACQPGDIRPRIRRADQSQYHGMRLQSVRGHSGRSAKANDRGVADQTGNTVDNLLGIELVGRDHNAKDRRDITQCIQSLVGGLQTGFTPIQSTCLSH